MLAFDFSGDGASATGTGPLEQDVAAAVAFLHGSGAATVALIGASKGAIVVLVAATTITPPVAGVVSLSAPADYQGTSGAVVRSLAVPVLYVAGRDETRFAADARTLYDATPPTTPRTLLLVPGSAHGVALLRTDPVAAEVRAAIDAFLRVRAPA